MNKYKETLRSGRCGWCYDTQHKASDCEKLKQKANEGNVVAIKYVNSLNGGGRLCAYCAGSGHTSTKCSKKFDTLKRLAEKEKIIAEPAFEWLKEIGFGPGAMLTGMSKEGYYSKRGKDERIVIISDFTKNTAIEFFKELLFGVNRNWYRVDGIDTCNEIIRNIYLPFHPLYSPRPTSTKVSILHKAKEEDVDKLKEFLLCYSSPVFNYDNAEDFFAAGYKFTSSNTKVPQVDDTLFVANQKKNSQALGQA